MGLFHDNSHRWFVKQNPPSIGPSISTTKALTNHETERFKQPPPPFDWRFLKQAPPKCMPLPRCCKVSLICRSCSSRAKGLYVRKETHRKDLHVRMETYKKNLHVRLDLFEIQLFAIEKPTCTRKEPPKRPVYTKRNPHKRPMFTRVWSSDPALHDRLQSASSRTALRKEATLNSSGNAE